MSDIINNSYLTECKIFLICIIYNNIKYTLNLKDKNYVNNNTVILDKNFIKYVLINDFNLKNLNFSYNNYHCEFIDSDYNINYLNKDQCLHINKIKYNIIENFNSNKN